MTEERTPVMAWDSQEGWAPGIVWWTRLDHRYQIEVQRSPEPTLGPEGVDVPDEARIGTLCIFDHANGDALIHSEPVGIAFGGPFGPDVSDVTEWQETAINVVDGLKEGS